ncbi:MAG: DUF6933 domain-containing protein [Ginsengibacter sp.]
MIIIYAVQKLLNTSGLKPPTYVSEPSENQYLHAWYAKLLATGFAGKQLVMYVHQPSLLLVLTRGKSINTTLPAFLSRLPQLMSRNNFKQDFVEEEMRWVLEGYVISRTNSRSMLASMNAITVNIEVSCRESNSYDLIDLNEIEDNYLDWLTLDAASGNYLRTKDYWVEKGILSR